MSASKKEDQMRWEYKRVYCSPGGEDEEDGLNRMGEDGWELIAVAASGGQRVLYFKRPKP